MNKTSVLLNLKALIWSVYVSYSDDTVAKICTSLNDGTVDSACAELNDTHLGKGLKIIMQAIEGTQDRALLAKSLSETQSSEASIVYRNMVIEIGHYVTPVAISGLPDTCHGVVSHIDSRMVDALFLLPNRTLVKKRVHPFELCPVYTLTISD